MFLADRQSVDTNMQMTAIRPGSGDGGGRGMEGVGWGRRALGCRGGLCKPIGVGDFKVGGSAVFAVRGY
jgi:hypothetical protein